MRAFILKCLVISSLVLASGPVTAQLAEPSAGNSALPNQVEVQPIQFEEIAVPSVANEAVMAAPLVAGDNLPAPTPNIATELGAALQSAVEYPVNDPSFLSGPVDAQRLVEPGFGHSTDIPIGDVIPEIGAEVYSTNNWFRGGQWYSKQEVIMLLRADTPLVHIAVDASTGSSDPFLVNAISTKEADFTYEAGARITLGKIIGRDRANRDHSIEFTFFGLFDHTGRARIEEINEFETGFAGIRSLLGTREANSGISAGGLGFQLINDVPGFTVNQAQNVLFRSQLNSFEFNYMVGARPARDRLIMQPDGRWARHATPSRIKGFYAGLRYLRQNELFHYTGEGGRNVFGNSLQERIDESGDYRVTTDNDLFGVQFGGDVVRKRTDWVFGANGRMGGLINFADRQSNYTAVVDEDDTAGVNLVTRRQTESLDDETLTFLVEAGAYVTYYVRPNTSLRVGYNALYMNGLATAANNIGLMGTFPKFETTGDTLYHGMSLGFEMTW